MSTIPVSDHGSASANGTALSAAISIANDGDTILIAHSAFPYDLGVFQFPASKSLTLLGGSGGETPVADPLGDGSPWGCFVRYATTVAGYFNIRSSAKVTFQHLGVTAPGWPAPLQSWQEFFNASYPHALNAIFTGNDLGELHFIDCEVWKGYGPSGVPISPDGINPATDDGYDDYKTPATYWFTPDRSGRITDVDPGDGSPSHTGYGNWTGENYNTIGSMPVFIAGRMSAVTLQNSWAHDLGQGVVCAYHENSVFTIDGSCVERTYSDIVQSSTAPEATGPLQEIRFSNSIFRDQLGSVFDDTAIHGDDNQNYNTIINSVLVGGAGYTDGDYPDVILSGATPDSGAVSAVAFVTVTDGEVVACALTSDDAGGLPVGTVLTAASGLGATGSGFSLTTLPLTRFQAMEVNNCLFMQSPGSRAQPQGIFWQGGGDHNVSENAVYDYPTFRNILIVNANKGISLATSRDVYLRNSTFVNAPWFTPIEGFGASVGAAYRSGNAWAENTRGLMRSVVFEGAGTETSSIDWKKVSAFVSPADPTTAFADPIHPPVSAHETYLNFKTIGAYAAAGPQYATLRDMLNDTAGFAGEPPHLSFIDMGGLEISTETLSVLSYIHGGNVGDLLSISAAAGVEWRTVDLDRSTQLTDWTATPTVVPVGKYLQIRATSPATYASSASLSVTLGGVVFPWALATRSNLAFPRVTKPATNTVVRTTSGALADDSPKGMLFMEIMVASGQVLSNHSLFTGAGNRAVACLANSAGGDVWTLTLEFCNRAGSRIATAGFADLASDTWYRVQFIADTSQPTVDLAILGQAENPLTGEVTVIGGKDYDNQNIGFSYNQGASGVQFMSELAGGFGMLALNCGEAFTAVTTNFNPENAGYQGEGLSPTSRQIEVFLPGEVTPDNRGTTGVPGGGEWGVNTGALTAANSAVWPPPLTLTAAPQSEGPYAVGLPIEILVQAIGRNEPITLTAASDGAGTFAANPQAVAEGVGGTIFAYTPTAEGSQTITVTNDMGYVNPDPMVLEIIAHGTISAGQTAVLTKTQALALQAVTDGAPIASGVGPAQLRWNTGDDETGTVTGVDIRFNIVP